MEPIFFELLYKHNVWEGYKISKNIDKTQMGESKDMGKKEMWYVLDCNKDSKIILMAKQKSMNFA